MAIQPIRRIWRGGLGEGAGAAGELVGAAEGGDAGALDGSDVMVLSLRVEAIK
jgi:hypothetical protein